MEISEELSLIVSYSRDEAMRTGYYSISVEHLLLGILRHRDNEACRELAALGVDPEDLKRQLDREVSRGWSVSYQEMDNIAPSREAHDLMNLTLLEAEKRGDGKAGSTHLLQCIAKYRSEVCRHCLAPRGVTAEALASLHAESSPRTGAAPVQTPAPRQGATSGAELILRQEMERLAIERALSATPPEYS